MNSNANMNMGGMGMIDVSRRNHNSLGMRQLTTTNNYYGNDRIKNDMEGEGILDIARGAYSKVKAVGSKLKNVGEKLTTAYGSQPATFLKNLAPDSDENARPSYRGEQHAIVQLPNGKYGMANYLGPKTELLKRLKRNGTDPPRTNTDKSAKAHDIRYAIAQGADTKEQQIKEIRRADNKMVSALDRVSNDKSDSRFNIEIGRKLIQGKILAEEAGLMKKGSFGGDLKKLSKEDRALLMKNEAVLEMEGYGKKSHLPAQALKMQIMKQYSKKGKGLRLAGDTKGRGTKTAGGGLKLAGSKGGGLKLAGSKGSGTKTAGKGINLAGTKGSGHCGSGGYGNIVMRGKGGLLDFIKSGLIPNLAKDLGIKSLPIQPILNIVKNADPKNMNDTAHILSKSLMPYLMKGQVDKVYDKKISGAKIMNVIKQLPKQLFDQLKQGISKALKAFSEMSGKGLKLSGGSWANFWKNFKKNFGKIVHKGLQIGGVIAGVLGQPEISLLAEGLATVFDPSKN